MHAPIDPIDWVAPEVLSFEVAKPTQASDIYSFGMILLELFSGGQPYEAEVDKVALVRNITRTPDFHRDYFEELLSTLPLPIANIITACCQREPDKRPTIEQVIDGLAYYKPAPEQQALIIQQLQVQAINNNPRALFHLGMRHLRGDAVEKDAEKAFSYFSKASQHGVIRAKFFLVKMYARGLGTTVDKPKAIQLYHGLRKSPYAMEKCAGVMQGFQQLLAIPTPKQPPSNTTTTTSPGGRGTAPTQQGSPGFYAGRGASPPQQPSHFPLPGQGRGRGI